MEEDREEGTYVHFSHQSRSERRNEAVQVMDTCYDISAIICFYLPKTNLHMLDSFTVLVEYLRN